jgi:hypothetical protein
LWQAPACSVGREFLLVMTRQTRCVVTSPGRWFESPAAGALTLRMVPRLDNDRIEDRSKNPALMPGLGQNAQFEQYPRKPATQSGLCGAFIRPQFMECFATS